MYNNETPNKNIHCTVNDCGYHCTSENYCSLNSVNIGTNPDTKGKKPDCPECTECDSFVAKTGAR